MTVTERNTKLDLILAQAMPEIEAHWQNCREFGLEDMTEATTDAINAAIGRYFERLKALNDPPTDAQILSEMKSLYDELNPFEGTLETDERELLVPVFIDAAVACGIDPQNYDGEPGGEYRDF